jgi:AraC family transcriptional regulator, regulatory protein of adaptative response / DNA-3-methyladenine glycosylase II
MRLIADGVVDREGVEGLARRLAYSPRQLRRLLRQQLGAGPLGLARAQRAQTARLLIETTDLPFAAIASAAGFASLRQFNETVREVFALAPTELRRRRKSRSDGRDSSALGAITLRLPHRMPLDSGGLLGFLAARAVPGIEEMDVRTFRRSLRLPHGDGVVELTPQENHVVATLHLADLRDLTAAVGRCRALFDLDADPQATDAALGRDPRLAPLVRSAPGKRVPGAADGAEIAIRAVLGQQVSLAAARTAAGRLVAGLGDPLEQRLGSVARTFPSVETLAEADLALLSLPATRALTIKTLARALAERQIDLDGGADRDEVRRRLLAIPGIGPWTAEYIVMRALADTDAFLATDRGVLRGLAALGAPRDPRAVSKLSEPWRPWRAYAVQHLWSLGSLQNTGTHSRPGVTAPEKAKTNL